MSVRCNICQQPTKSFAKEKILGKYNVQYFQCNYCEFIQTEYPYWLNESYSDAITSSDIGLIGRNVTLSRMTRTIISGLYDSNGKFLDYGGGYGIFVRMMRDYGFDYYLFDKFCANLFAKGFNIDGTQQNNYELVTAFEVFEHLVHPLHEIEDMLKFSKNLLFSTALIPSSNPKPNEWWYYGLDHGQHVSLYSQKSLIFIARKFGLNLYSHGNTFHLMTKKRIPRVVFNLLTRRKVIFLTNIIHRKTSLLPQDYFRITGRVLG